MKNTIIALLLIILVAAGLYFLLKNPPQSSLNPINTATTTDTQASTTDQVVQDTTKTVIGTSTEDNKITAYHYGNGGTNLLFVAGVHGGYSWNTSLLSYQVMEVMCTHIWRI